MKKILLAGAVAAAVMLTAPTQAQTPAPEGLSLQLSYDGRLYVKILSVELEQSVGPRAFHSNLRITAEGPLALFKKLDVRASAEGEVARGTAAPANFSYRSRSGQKERVLTASWRGGDVEMNAAPAFASMGEPPATRQQKLESADPLTQLMRLTLTSEPCAGTARFFDGKQRYNLHFSERTTGELDERQRALGLEAPVRCQARQEKLAGFKLKKTAAESDAVSMEDMGITMARIGADGPWVITSLTVGTGLGNAHLKLVRMKVTGADSEQLARIRGESRS